MDHARKGFSALELTATMPCLYQFSCVKFSHGIEKSEQVWIVLRGHVTVLLPEEPRQLQSKECCSPRLNLQVSHLHIRHTPDCSGYARRKGGLLVELGCTWNMPLSRSPVAGGANVSCSNWKWRRTNTKHFSDFSLAPRENKLASMSANVFICRGWSLTSFPNAARFVEKSRDNISILEFDRKIAKLIFFAYHFCTTQQDRTCFFWPSHASGWTDSIVYPGQLQHVRNARYAATIIWNLWEKQPQTFIANTSPLIQTKENNGKGKIQKVRATITKLNANRMKGFHLVRDHPVQQEFRRWQLSRSQLIFQLDDLHVVQSTIFVSGLQVEHCQPFCSLHKTILWACHFKQNSQETTAASTWNTEPQHTRDVVNSPELYLHFHPQHALKWCSYHCLWLTKTTCSHTICKFHPSGE